MRAGGVVEDVTWTGGVAAGCGESGSVGRCGLGAGEMGCDESRCEEPRCEELTWEDVKGVAVWDRVGEGELGGTGVGSSSISPRSVVVVAWSIAGVIVASMGGVGAVGA